MKQQKEKQIKEGYPKGKLTWLWENMEGYRRGYIFGLIESLICSALFLVIPYFSSRIIDTFLASENAAENMANNRSLFFMLIACMMGLTFFRTVLQYICIMHYEKGSQEALYRIRQYLYDKIQHQDMKFYATYRTGDLMTRLTGDLDAIRHMLAWVIRNIIESLALALSVAIYFLIMDWKMALCLLVTAPLLFVVIRAFSRKIGPKHALLREKFAHLNTMAQENISGNKVVRAFAREDYEIEKFDACNVDYRETNKETAMVWISYFPIIETMANILPVIMMLVGGLFLINGEMTMGEYTAFSGLIWALANPMRNLGNIMNEFQRFSAASEKVMEIYYSEPSIFDEENAIPHPERFSGKIEFRNVSFEYLDEKADGPVLHNIDFVVEPGQTVAIMGETGCGKSSLIHLLPRFYDPSEGQVLIDGVDIRTLKLSDLRRNIGLATQEVLLYSDTIDGNIAFGDPSMPEQDVHKYARYSAARNFIRKMPDGYNTVVGERGVGLSGGQKQRIALARALAIKPSILILDDTTSAVDMETEKTIQEGLNNLDFECTKLIIAQRISTTKTADLILILQDGRIIESGTHDELVAQNGYYAEVVRLQTGEKEGVAIG